MNRETAVALMDALLKLGPPLNEATAVTFEITDEAERQFVRRRISDAMQATGYELVMHIVRQYPDLDPDKKG